MNILGTVLLALVMQSVSLQGVVVRKGTTDGLSRATVELRPDQDNAGILDSITTEDDGRFSFRNVAPGRYRLTVVRAGYTRSPLILILAAGQPTEDIPLNMSPAGSISGHVFDAGGHPLGNVEVRAMKASYAEGRRVLTPVQSVLTNDLGEYRLFWLAPGRYYLSAVHPRAQGMSRRLFGTVRTSTNILDGFISPGDDDPALAGFDFRQDLETETEHYAPIFFGGTTDDQTAAEIDLRGGADYGGANFVVEPVRARHVRGVVIDGITGNSAQYGNITLPKDLNSPPSKDVAVDREKGTFDMLLFPGLHTLNASSASGEGYVSFTLGDADIDNLTIPTSPLFEIPGRIVVDGEPVSASAIESLHMTLRRDPPRGEPSTTFYTTPLPDGTFRIPTSAGDFRINIAPILNVTPARFPSPLWTSLQNAYVKSIQLGNTDVLNGILHLDRQPSTSLEVVIATNPGALDGQVVGSGPAPIADSTVLLLPDLRHRNELYRTTIADAAGRFHFDHVPPGDYKVFSWAEIEDGAWYDADFMKTNESRGTPVRIGAGQTGTVRVDEVP